MPFEYLDEPSKFEYLDETPKDVPLSSEFEALHADRTANPLPAIDPLEQTVDSKPVEQKLLENTIAAGNGVTLPSGVMSLGRTIANLGKKAPTAIEEVASSPSINEPLIPINQSKPPLGASQVPPPPQMPPKMGGYVPPVEPPPAAPVADPLADVKAYVLGKANAAAAKPGFGTTVGKYLKNESLDLGGKDLGISPMQIKSMGPGFAGNEKAEALVQYAMDKGLLNPALGTIGRKEAIQKMMTESGAGLGKT